MLERLWLLIRLNVEKRANCLSRWSNKTSYRKIYGVVSVTVRMSSNMLAAEYSCRTQYHFLRNTGNETDAGSVLCPW